MNRFRVMAAFTAWLAIVTCGCTHTKREFISGSSYAQSESKSVSFELDEVRVTHVYKLPPLTWDSQSTQLQVSGFARSIGVSPPVMIDPNLEFEELVLDNGISLLDRRDRSGYSAVPRGAWGGTVTKPRRVLASFSGMPADAHSVRTMRGYLHASENVKNDRVTFSLVEGSTVTSESGWTVRLDAWKTETKQGTISITKHDYGFTAKDFGEPPLYITIYYQTPRGQKEVGNWGGVRPVVVDGGIKLDFRLSLAATEVAPETADLVFSAKTSVWRLSFDLHDIPLTR